MAKYPVEIGDDEGTADALNYLLSGPGGLGQNFAGFSSYAPAYLTGNFRIPFSQTATFKDVTGVNGEYTIIATDVSGIVIGQTVIGTDIGVGALVTNITGNTITLSIANTGDVDTTAEFIIVAKLYVPPIALSNAEQLDNRTIKYTFASVQPSAPFSLGNGFGGTSVQGITPSSYNSISLRNAGTPILQIGVVECTDSYVIVRTRDVITTSLGTYVSGGTIEYDVMDIYNSTDCDVRVTVTGGTDRVFVSGQLNQIISYEVDSGSADLNVYVAIRRYKGFINNNPVNPDYIFNPDDTIVEKKYEYIGLTGTGTLPLLETVFTSVVDMPQPAYYRYILEVYFETVLDPIFVTLDEMQVRSISAQVVKQ